MGTLDRFVPLAIVAAVVVLYVTGVLPALAAIILGIASFTLLVTPIVGFCPLCALFDISTRKRVWCAASTTASLKGPMARPIMSQRDRIP